MKKLFVAGIIMLASMIAGSAFADSGASSGSQSGANAQVNVNSSGGKSYKGTGAAFAPGLTASGLSCSGSVSTGAGGSGWGIAFGTTKMDEDCNTRENAKLANGLGGLPLAKEVACNIKQIRDAYKLTGRPCMIDRDRTTTARFGGVGTMEGYPTSDPLRRAAAYQVTSGRSGGH